MRIIINLLYRNLKSNSKLKIIILIILGIFFALLPIMNTNLIFIMNNNSKSSKYSDEINRDNKNLKISAASRIIHIENKFLLD